MKSVITAPLTFEPIFMERIWGGRRLQSLFGKRLPPGIAVGESWELVDRPEAQSVVHAGPLRGKTLHELWMNHRQKIFGQAPDAPRFPILLKLLDAQRNLSMQVHPPPGVAEELGGEPKTEFWYIAEAAADAKLYVGLTRNSSRDSFIATLGQGNVIEHVHCIAVKTGDAMFLPSGRVHAIGAGNLIVEVQQNSDTTYRIYDWERSDRQLHIDEGIRSIDFDDVEPSLTTTDSETLVRQELFQVEKWQLSQPRDATAKGQFAIIGCLTGKVRCSEVTISAGHFFLIPASLQNRELLPASSNTSLLRITIPTAV